ncbi:MAG: hypothetical protein ACOYOF_16940, partial [Verrucomicrobiaceae bacterium]
PQAARLTASRVNSSKLSAMICCTSFSACSSVCFDALFFMSDGGLCSLSRPLQPVVGAPTIRTYVLTITRTLPKPFKGQYQITELSDRDYGMTEFHINDPNGCLIFVGQETRQPA